MQQVLKSMTRKAEMQQKIDDMYSKDQLHLAYAQLSRCKYRLIEPVVPHSTLTFDTTRHSRDFSQRCSPCNRRLYRHPRRALVTA